MQKVQLYIEGTRVDLFKDETISLTQTIQDVKDIEKVFTDFSKTFSIPASKTNNKLFKHYYNFDIVDGFDARKKVDAYIELNSIRFRTGKVTLQSVGMKNNVANSYKITFFGNTVTLKELIGEDKLSALTGMEDLTTDYDDVTMLAKLQADPTTDDLIAPLITHTDRLVYDSGGNSFQGNEPPGENLVRPGAGNEEGLDFDQLKYAVRVHRIIQAIEETYSITFSDDFFIDTNTNYYELFMWMHRKKGEVESLSGSVLKIADTFTATLGGPDASNTQMISNTTLQVFAPNSFYGKFDLDVTTSTTFVAGYRVLIYVNGVENYRSDLLTSSTTITKSDFDLGINKYTVYIESDEAGVFDFTWDIEYGASSTSKTHVSSSYSFSPTFDFEISQQIPEMKVLDFLTGIFKMFNLTAYIEDNIVKVQTLDDFYSNGISYDISKYIDVNTSSVGVALPYKEIVFKYKDTDTLLAKQHTQISGQEWAEEDYNDSDDSLSGDVYTVELPFSHLKYERLINEADGSNTTVQYGYFVDDNRDSYFGSPLLFYPILQSSANAINFIYANGTKVSLANYNIPSNSIGISRVGDLDNINFKAEINEYTNSSDFTDTLFKNYYESYISSVFNPKNRLTKFTAYLPLRILLNYNLSDRFVINSRSYKINSITTDLTTGKSSLELLNDL